ncbi:Major Facilitator Superfamily protein [anaerobic digester metagenome]
MMTFSSRLSNRRKRAWFIVVGLALYPLLSFIHFVAGSVADFNLVRVVHGFASVLVLPIALVNVTDFSRIGAEGRDLGTFFMALCLEMGLGPLVAGVINSVTGMDAVFLAMAPLSIAALLICLVLVPESMVCPRPFSAQGSALKHPVMCAVVSFQLINVFANGTFIVFIPLIASLFFDFSTADMGIVIIISLLTTSLLQR